MRLSYKILSLALALSVSAAFAQKKNDDVSKEIAGLRAVGSPSNPKVQMNWSRYHDLKQMEQFYKDLQKAYPDLIKYESIGKSYEGRDIFVLTVTDFKQGQPERKPAMWIDGNIHANELQGSEISMYTAWYLLENYNTVPFIKELLKD